MRSQKQIEWSKQLGKKSQEFKRAKKQKLMELDSKTEPEIETEPILIKETEKKPFNYYWVIIPGTLLIGGGLAWLYKSKIKPEKKEKKKAVAPPVKSTLIEMA